MRRKPSEIIASVQTHKGNCARAALELGIHRTTVWRWVKRSNKASKGRFAELTSRGLKRFSTRPHTIHYKFLEEDKKEAKKLRKAKKYDASKIRKQLGLSVVPLTIHRFLKEEGSIVILQNLNTT